MEEALRAKALHFSKKIYYNASKGNLWNRTPKGPKINIKSSAMIPQFKIDSEITDLINAQGMKKSKPGVIQAKKYSKRHFLKVYWYKYRIADLTSPQASSRYDIKVLAPKKTKSKQEWELLYNGLLFGLDKSLTEMQHIEPFKLVKGMFSFTRAVKGNDSIRAVMTVLYPKVDIQFTPINPLKIVSTPLSISITARKQTKGFQSGFLTLDQNKRVIPLMYTDPMTLKYPLVGVWVANIPISSNQRSDPLWHPLIWSAVVRYIQSHVITNRVSPSPSECTFLFAYFSHKPKFYEVNTYGQPRWTTKRVEADLKAGDQAVLNFDKCQIRICASPQPVIDSRPESPAAESIMMQQTLHIQMLERQIKELQNKVFKPNSAGKPNSKPHSRKMSIPNFIPNPEQKVRFRPSSRSTDFDFAAWEQAQRVESPVISVRKQNDYNPLYYSDKDPVESSKKKLINSRSANYLDIINLKKKEEEETTIPKIVYESDHSEDDASTVKFF